ncbi:MAG: DUF4145 domain-containing protein [Deltaproteobacteria bacterium]|nr:DUF4145 domain-containing protein [Deltaproteobacteria bacterium]
MNDELKYRGDKFQCPNCGVVAQQQWFSNYELSHIVFNIYNHIYLDYRSHLNDYEQNPIQEFLRTAKEKFPEDINSFVPKSLSIAICQSCGKYSLWVEQEMVYPRKVSIEPPNEDLNEEIKAIYKEAATIFLDSPRGATALLRLALQMLLKELGKEGKNINGDIKELVEDGLSQKIQKALDLLRVIGNNAVHPGQINLDDNKDVALKLFKILNIIANEMITKPKEIATLYEEIIPEETKKHIDTRDGKKINKIT